MRGLADEGGVVAIGDDQARFARQKGLALENRGKIWRHRPIEMVAEIEVIGPLAVAEEVRFRDLDLDDRQVPLGIDTHQVGSPAVRQRDLADREQFLPAEQARHAASYVRRNRRIGKTAFENRFGGGAHPELLERFKNAGNAPRRGRLAEEDVVTDRSDAFQPPARVNAFGMKEQRIAYLRLFQILVDDLRDRDRGLPLAAALFDMRP